jgi:hypothetical protein
MHAELVPASIRLPAAEETGTVVLDEWPAPIPVMHADERLLLLREMMQRSCAGRVADMYRASDRLDGSDMQNRLRHQIDKEV